MVKSFNKKNKKLESAEKSAQVKASKLTKAERKQIKAARKARAKARSSTKLSVRIVGLILALVMTMGFVIPGVIMMWKTFFGAKSEMFDSGKDEELRKLLEELSRLKAQDPSFGADGSGMPLDRGGLPDAETQEGQSEVVDEVADEDKEQNSD